MQRCWDRLRCGSLFSFGGGSTGIIWDPAKKAGSKLRGTTGQIKNPGTNSHADMWDQVLPEDRVYIQYRQGSESDEAQLVTPMERSGRGSREESDTPGVSTCDLKNCTKLWLRFECRVYMKTTANATFWKRPPRSNFFETLELHLHGNGASRTFSKTLLLCTSTTAVVNISSAHARVDGQ